MYVAALDASKAFNRINHKKLFALLKKCNVSESLLMF